MEAITDQTFKAEVLDASGLVLVDFWAPWCGPCKNFMPTVEEALGDLGNIASGVSVNIDENPETPSQYGVMSIPTLLLFKDGQLVDTMVGSQHTKDDLIRWVKSFEG